MKLYIATSLERARDHNLVRDELLRRGHTLTYDWTTHGSVQDQGLQRIREVAAAELRGVVEAGMVVVLLPGGRGTHVELGIALGAGKPVLLHTDGFGQLYAGPQVCAFYHAPGTIRTVGALIDVAKSVEIFAEQIRAGLHP